MFYITILLVLSSSVLASQPQSSQECVDKYDLEGKLHQLSYRLPRFPGSSFLYHIAIRFFFDGHHEGWTGEWEMVEEMVTSYLDKDKLLKAKEKKKEIMDNIERHARQPENQHPYGHYPLLQDLFNEIEYAEDKWLSLVSIASDYVVHVIDKVNIILNGGVFTPEIKMFREFHSFDDKLHILRVLSMVVNLPTLEEDFMV